MKEVRGDLWGFPADAYVVTTNGAIRADGAAVMGRGVALQAKSRFPGIEHALGKLIREYGNHVGVIPRLAGWPPVAAISFPVKHHWRQAARSRLDYPFGQGSCLDFGGALDDYRSPPSWVWQRTPSLGECRTLSGRAR